MKRIVWAGIGLVVGGLALAGYYLLQETGAGAAGRAVPPLLVIPIVLAVALGVTMLAMAWWLRRRPQRRTDLVDAWPRSRALLLVISMSLLAVALFGFGVTFLRWNWVAHWPALETAVVGVLFLTAVLIGWFSLRRALILPPENPALIDHLLHRQPHEIAWVYQIAISLADGHAADTTTICLWMADGRSHQIALPQQQAHLLLDMVRECAPHAQIGYNEATEAQYRQNPACFMPKNQPE